jgi:sugar diacid utilization regulator
VQTLETFLDCDGNVAGTAARLYTHRHTIRYRLERVRDSAASTSPRPTAARSSASA